MAELPYEIWQHITSFLDKGFVWSLYAVNKVLFSIVMDERYRRVCIGSPRSVDDGRGLLQIHIDAVVSRIRTLCIRHGETAGNAPIPHHSFIKALLRRLRRKEKTTPEARQYKAIMRTLEKMVSVTALELEMSQLHDPLFHSFKFEALSSTWRIMGARLVSLSLDVPSEDLGGLLREVELPQLQHLAMQIFFSSKTTPNKDQILPLTLLPFFSSHKKTLASLAFECYTDVDVSSFLMQVPHMTSLVSFKLVQSFVLTATKAMLLGHTQFLSAHAASLRHLHIRLLEWHNRWASNPNPTSLSRPPTWFEQTLCRVPFASLKSLHFVSLLEEKNLADVVTHLRQHHASLTSLELSSTARFAYNHAFRLFGDSPSAQFVRLKHLDLAVDCLSPALLQLFADTLPALHSLVLHPRYASADKDIQADTRLVYDPGEGFFGAIQSLCFPNWSLNSLDLDFYGFSDKQAVGRVISAAIPRLEYFCGVHCRNNAQPPQKLPLKKFLSFPFESTVNYYPAFS